ncbi:MAG: ATP-binding protein [Acidobacteria bacterium]|nr:ATP-binding protein [Acidobacteriota bacterium]
MNLSSLLPADQSCFLFGPRGVGKTHLVEDFLVNAGASWKANLLEEDLYSRYLTQPSLIRHEVESHLRSIGGAVPRLTVFIDEVQRLPNLLNEVHALIERHRGKIRFILTGSSARKLRRGGANLLAGRAWTLHLHPLTHRESVTDLMRALQYGTLPGIYLSESAPERALRAYVQTYLKEEIRQEAMLRRIDGFVRFMDVAGQTNGEPVNFTKIGRDCGVSTKTVQDYYSILVDTLVAFRLDGWSHSVRKQLRQQPKFYWFDCGVLNAIRGELGAAPPESSSRFGNLFETWVIQEMIRLNDYAETDYRFHYWRTNTGMEADIVLSHDATHAEKAIEIKSGTAPVLQDVRGLISFQSENPGTEIWCVCRTPRVYTIGAVQFLPWKDALAKLFPGA